MSKLHRNIRTSTKRHFIKKGICEECGFEGATTWHHKRYLQISKGLKRNDIQELCRNCHKRKH